MYYKMNCLITIKTQEGKTIRFTAVNDCEIEKSIDKIGSMAKIKIPASARLVSGGFESSTQTAKQFKRGDKINIRLGYDDRLKEEFDGFIYKINLSSPLEIECEGHEFLLREDVPVKTFPETNLKDLLKYIIADKPLKFDENIPELNMTNYVIPADLSRVDALQQVKEKYGIIIFFLKDTLYAGLDFIKYIGNVKYSLGVNTPKADELKYQYAEDVKIRVKAVLYAKNNTKIEIEVGDPKGQLRTEAFYGVKNKEDLKKLAEAKIDAYKFDGYTGNITTFLEPFACPGMTAEIRDINYSERAGKFEIRSVKTRFSTSGGRRTVEIGKAVTV